MPTQIQYPYALDEKNNLVLIESIERKHKREHKYCCPCCGKPMIPRIGESNAPHFAHADNQKCGIESYIHVVAKRILATRFNDCSFWGAESSTDRKTGAYL